MILWMEDILHHLGYLKPCQYWDKLSIKWCRISSINSTGVWLGWVMQTVPPEKINMEPENHPVEKENHLPNLHCWVPSCLTSLLRCPGSHHLYCCLGLRSCWYLHSNEVPACQHRYESYGFIDYMVFDTFCIFKIRLPVVSWDGLEDQSDFLDVHSVVLGWNVPCGLRRTWLFWAWTAWFRRLLHRKQLNTSRILHAKIHFSAWQWNLGDDLDVYTPEV